MGRLLLPILKKDQQYQEISFDEAFQCIANHCGSSPENATLVMTSGNYSNEELYTLQRLARTGFHTNALGSFDYYQRGTAFFIDKNDIVPFAELLGSTTLYCLLDSSIDSVPNKMIYQVIEECTSAKKYFFNRPGTLNIQNWASFFRCLNYFLIKNDLAKGIYVNGLGKDYDSYKEKILSEDFNELLHSNHLDENDIQRFISDVQKEEAPVFVVWERFLDERGIIELENLCMLLDIQAKPSRGFLAVKGDLNSQGLFDMGIFPNVFVGGQPATEEVINLMQELYKHPVCATPADLPTRISQKDFENCLYFNNTGNTISEELTDCAAECHFSVLQTAMWDHESDTFDLILPATLPDEITGTFTDSARIPHHSTPLTESPVSYNNLQQLSHVGAALNITPMENPTDIFMEYISFFKSGCRSKFRHFFR